MFNCNGVLNPFGLFINRLSNQKESVKPCLLSETFNFKLKCTQRTLLPKGMKNSVIKILLWIKSYYSIFELVFDSTQFKFRLICDQFGEILCDLTTPKFSAFHFNYPSCILYLLSLNGANRKRTQTVYYDE